ncbi:hypothetical protein [Actinomadura sp. 7K507]|uniref:hypothetical protein n=1 Tax=Actinomadura sp. 7K507 TaxID=2530365 RepID=UPI00104D716B|nr:hypothetical protein [Actinomadura sp. 7K507]TDC80539.1 hypothetical protein E1285_34780 [Actinomadura sp. 7K507]
MLISIFSEGHAMSHQPPSRRRAAPSVIAAAALLAPALAFPGQAVAYAAAGPGDCVKPDDIDCNATSITGGTSGGGGTGGGGGGASGPVQPPDPVGLTENQGVGFVDVPGEPPAPAPPSTFLLVQQANDSAAFPIPTVHTAPTDKTYVRLRTNLWVEGFGVVQTDPVSAGAQTVQATAKPSSVTWDLGEKKLVCQDAGSKDGETCHYTFKRSSTGQPGGSYKITATVTWTVSWTCEGDDCDTGGGDLGTTTRTSQPTPLVVSEIQTNTGQ